MKKEYKKPQMEVVEMTTENTIALDISGTTLGWNENGGSNGGTSVNWE